MMARRLKWPVSGLHASGMLTVAGAAQVSWQLNRQFGCTLCFPFNFCRLGAPLWGRRPYIQTKSTNFKGATVA